MPKRIRNKLALVFAISLGLCITCAILTNSTSSMVIPLIGGMTSATTVMAGSVLLLNWLFA